MFYVVLLSATSIRGCAISFPHSFCSRHVMTLFALIYRHIYILFFVLISSGPTAVGAGGRLYSLFLIGESESGYGWAGTPYPLRHWDKDAINGFLEKQGIYSTVTVEEAGWFDITIKVLVQYSLRLRLKGAARNFRKNMKKFRRTVTNQ